MNDWVITATTIYCDAVEDEVTLIAGKDGTIKCTGFNKYFSPNKDTAKSIKRRSTQLKKKLECEGLGCHRVTQYQGKVFSKQA